MTYIVYTNKTATLPQWIKMTGERLEALGLVPGDYSALAYKHGYEMGYTPERWSRERELTEYRKFRAKNLHIDDDQQRHLY
jgi:hypothetical protein